MEESLKVLTDVMIRDITSPPVASRSYVYSIIAFYEASKGNDQQYSSYSNRLNGLASLPVAYPDSQYNILVSGRQAFYKTAYFFAFSKDLFQTAWDSLMKRMPSNETNKLINERSVRYGNEIAQAIIAWAKQDHYIKTRGMPRFTEGKKPGEWKQTPPDYMEAVEPNWKHIRPMLLSKPNEFEVIPPSIYNDSIFVQECKEVYEITSHLSKKQKLAANFWDCNPFATTTIGHMVYSVKKLSPAGHWIGITGAAIRKSKQDLRQALTTYSLVSISMFDAIISAWDEKYRSNYIRPVTAIQQSISPTWQPLLQTPPFPEYPSGHSVISMSAATVLTKIFGPRFKYTDDAEVAYGLQKRTFPSFYDAANEAAISRLYGGIHFREAIENGKDLGKRVGMNVIQKLM